MKCVRSRERFDDSHVQFTQHLGPESTSTKFSKDLRHGNGDTFNISRFTSIKIV